VSLVTSPRLIVERAEASGHPGLLGRAAAWRRRPVAGMVRIVNGAPFRSTNFNTAGRGVPLIRIRDVGGAGVSTYYDGDFDPAYLVKPGALLVGMDGDFRVAPWTGPAALLNQRVCRLDVVDAALDARWLRHVLQGYLDAIWAETSSVTVKHLSSRSIGETPIPVPPIDEQRRIVEILEDHLSRLDAADAYLDASHRRATSYARSVLQEAVARAWRDPLVRTVQIGDIAQVRTGATPLKSQSGYYLDGTIPWITSGDLATGLICGASQFITERALRETAVKVFPAGTLLVAMYGEGKTRGTVAELAIDATTNQACAAIQLREETQPWRRWIRLVLESRYEEMRRLAAGGVQPNLNLSLIRRVAIPVPPEDRQQALCSWADELHQVNHRLSADVEQARARSSQLRRALLRAAFTGRLTGRDRDADVLDELADFSAVGVRSQG